MIKAKKTAGRPVDQFAIARATIKELRGDAKRLETIAKKMRYQASQLKNEIDVQKGHTPKKRDDSTFMDVKSSINGAVIQIKTRNEITQDSIEKLFD